MEEAAVRHGKVGWFTKVNAKWKEVMEYLRRDATTAMKGAQEPDIMKKLREMFEKLEEIQKVLENFLQQKRNSFPRFYFLSNDDLLEIISKQKDPKCFIPHMKKMFQAISSLTFEIGTNAEGKPQTIATQMISDDEIVQFDTPVPIIGDVDKWLKEIEAEMRRTILSILSLCRAELMRGDSALRVSLLNNDKYPGQCFLTSSQIRWTYDTERNLDATSKGSLKVNASASPVTRFCAMQTIYISELISLVRGNLAPLIRKKVKSLLVIEDHSRNAIQEIIRYSGLNEGKVTKDDFG
jgi:dynein heavy chain